MSDESALATITATPAATRALSELQRMNGDVILHVTGGAEDAGTPVCLDAGELLIGPRDVLLGTVDGVPMYQMRTTPGAHYIAEEYVLDVVKGFAVGFSLSPGEGLRFALRETKMRAHR